LPSRYRWKLRSLSRSVTRSLKKLRQHNKLRGDRSCWWPFIFSWPKEEAQVITQFIEGTYRFEPLKTYRIQGESGVVWSFKDRLFVRAVLELIKPVFKHIIPKNCLHTKGPTGVGTALDLTQKALEKGKFRYFIRADIAGYYASIDRKILTEQTKGYFNDPRILNYLDQIINIPIIDEGAIHIPQKGVHTRSSISPLLAALYLRPLDKLFENRPNLFYVRYCDDVLILAKTKKQFLKAKRQMQQVLQKLRLTYARRKTKMGALTKGFHFLGLEFNQVNQDVSALPEQQEAPFVEEVAAQTQPLVKSHVSVILHERCCSRSLEKVVVMEVDSVATDKVLQYLSRWSAWWSRSAPAVSISKVECLKRWVKRAAIKKPQLAWVGVALLKGPLFPHRLSTLDSITR
jgi:RNA-directed DNA polymerase